MQFRFAALTYDGGAYCTTERGTDPQPKRNSMTLQRIFTCFFSLFLLGPALSFASDVTIGVLPGKLCALEDYNSNVYSATTPPGTETKCVLTFLSKSKDGSASAYETEALMYINGSLVYLHRTNTTMPYELVSEDESVSAILRVKETGSSCIEGEDKCCGSDFSGTLTVNTVRGKASLKVGYYRGG